MYDPVWREHFPEMTDADVGAFDQLAAECEGWIERGEIMDVESYNELPFTDADRLASYVKGAEHIREILRKSNCNKRHPTKGGTASDVPTRQSAPAPVSAAIRSR